MAKSTTKKSRTVKTKRPVVKGKTTTKRAGATVKSHMLSVPKVLNKALLAKAAEAGIPFNRYCINGLKKFAGL